MKFRIWEILWAFALLASAMATFGTYGVLATIAALSIWSGVWCHKRFVGWELLIASGTFSFFVFLLSPAVRIAHETNQRGSCASNLKQLSLAILMFEDLRKAFPASREVHNESGFLHSWRLSVYPLLLQPPIDGPSYQKNKRWDSPENMAVTSIQFPQFALQCPAHKTDAIEAHYFAIVGERTMWPPDRGRKVSEITDGTANTILLIEAPHKPIPWAKPEDLSFDEAVELLTSPPTEDYGHAVRSGFFYKPVRGINVAFADGSAQWIEVPISKAAAEALLTVDGGEPINPDNLTVHHRPKLNYARIYSLSVFVLLSISPVFNLRKRSKSPTTDNATG